MEPPPPAPPAPSHSAPAGGSESWCTEALRAAAILLLAAAAGITVNYFQARPVPLFSSNGPGAWPELAERITIEQVLNLLNTRRSVLIVDVRSEADFKQAHARKSPQMEVLNIPSGAFLDYYHRYPALAVLISSKDMVAVLCSSAECPSGDRVANSLRELRHNNVRVLHGGWISYRKSELPVEEEPR